MIRFNPALPALLCALALHGQVRVNEAAVLPADKNAKEIILIPPDNAPKPSQAMAGEIHDKNNNPISPEPAVAVVSQTDGSLKVTLSAVYFWGDAFLPITFAGAAPGGRGPVPPPLTATYKLERGVIVSSSSIDIPRSQPGVIWVQNPDVVPIRVGWRVVSGIESLCGLDDQGHLRKDCDNISELPEVRIPATGSAPIRFDIPPWWRNPLQVFGGTETKRAQLNLRFGQGQRFQQSDSDLQLTIHSNILDAATAWVPELTQNLLRVLFWITVGATLLMLAQVVIPNFRRSLQMEVRIDELKERLRAINSGVGNRLYTKCQQEISRVTQGLGIREPDGRLFAARTIFGASIWLPRFNVWLSFFNLSRVALCGNSQEILRLEALLPKIESRLALTERLSDVLTGFLAADTLACAPSSVFDREEQLRSLREILSRQLLTDVEEDSASAILDQLETEAPSPSDFAVDLNSRLEALRRQLTSDVFKTRAASYIQTINGCGDILAETPDSAPPGGWTVDELVFRDLIAVKLRLIVFAIEIEKLLAKSPQAVWIQERLESSDPAVLAKIHAALKRISQGVSEQDILAALKDELWDTLSEPPTVRSQDVLQFSFWFRDKALNRSSARDSFQCYWKVADLDTGAESWEEGWTLQYIPSFRRFTVEPEIYDSAGHELVIRKVADPPNEQPMGKGRKARQQREQERELERRGIVEIRVARATGVSTRAIRGFIDAIITALVPVVTVAVTQVQNGGALTANKLVLLGFTSQAIRAAILPESVRPEAAPKTLAADSKSLAKATPASSPSPASPPPTVLSKAPINGTATAQPKAEIKPGDAPEAGLVPAK
jgi:hypothetical protein